MSEQACKLLNKSAHMCRANSLSSLSHAHSLVETAHIRHSADGLKCLPVSKLASLRRNNHRHGTDLHVPCKQARAHAHPLAAQLVQRRRAVCTSSPHLDLKNKPPCVWDACALLTQARLMPLFSSFGLPACRRLLSAFAVPACAFGVFTSLCVCVMDVCVYTHVYIYIYVYKLICICTQLCISRQAKHARVEVCDQT
jgi:hypothetical protein